MTNEELREKAGRMLFETLHDIELIQWSTLNEAWREVWRRDAWKLVQLGLAAGLREAANKCRDEYARQNKLADSHPSEEYSSHDAKRDCSQWLCEQIEARAKEVEHAE